LYIVKAQLDMAGNQIKSASYYRATMIKDLEEFIKKHIEQSEIGPISN